MHGGKTAEAENPYSIEVSHDLEDRRWDEFVSRCPGGHHEQTSLWAQVKSHYGWRPVRGVVARNGELAGGFQLLTKPFKWGGKIGYVSRGPVSICQDPRLLGAITDEVDRLARKEGIQYLVVVPSYAGHAFGSHFKDRGYLFKPEHLPPTGIPEATLILDLGLDNDQILSHMRPEIRRVVKNGYRQGMTVRECFSPYFSKKVLAVFSRDDLWPAVVDWAGFLLSSCTYPIRWCLGLFGRLRNR